MAQVALNTADFTDREAQDKSALNAQFIFALALYPFVLGAAMQIRGSWMSLVNPRPHPSPSDGPDLWRTDDPLTVASTIITFLLVLVAHYLLVSHLTLRPLPGLPRLGRIYSSVPALALLLCTTGFYLNYLRSTRYGVSPVEWGVFAVAIAIMGVMTLFLVLVPFKQRKVVRLGQAP